METTVELILFFIVGGVAIAAAAMMLMSENAVHSALFLILNFACVAFLYLMLNAAFLAMVQVTVYAGAIMVLFMFVIMLLGSERLTPDSLPRFPWLTRAAVALAMVFLALAGYFIIESNISSTDPEPLQPMVQVINTVPDFESVDVYLNDQLVAEDVEFRETSEFVELPIGEYAVSFKGHEEAESQPVSLVEAASLTLEDNQTVALILLPTDEGYAVLPLPKDLETVEHKYETNVQLVHAAPGYGSVELADITQPDAEPRVIVETLEFGEVSETVVMREGEHQFALYGAGAVDTAIAGAGDDPVKASSIKVMHRPEKLDLKGNTTTVYVVTPPIQRNIPGQVPDLLHFTNENRPAFGGPTSIG
ncbi:MAG: NADH-quinone oxidoreductase subunit J, partial [Anaerolineae bacterium]|nr:NADH-quinone oxidoreductase subunit J [Anaerolineae bacterium]